MILMRHRKANRYKNFDYSYNGIYFVTICSKNREELFGYITESKMNLNDFGVIAKQCWTDIPLHFSHVILDRFIVMPNHIHGILIIKRPVQLPPIENKNGPHVCGHYRYGGVKEYGNDNKTKSYLSKVIQQYKAVVTRNINRIQDSCIMQWQRSYYERIIRNEKEMKDRRGYIINNPLNWVEDIENPRNKNR